jgi:hypothetical protein
LALKVGMHVKQIEKPFSSDSCEARNLFASLAHEYAALTETLRPRREIRGLGCPDRDLDWRIISAGNLADRAAEESNDFVEISLPIFSNHGHSL